MKRYASHFLFLPGHGCLKQYVVEMGEGQGASRVFPLTEEVENTEWLPGVIVLLPFEEAHLGQETVGLSFDKCHNILTAVPPGIEEKLPYLVPWLFSPFDFTTMQPGAGTQRKLLQ
ncbi:hypothetical protein [uncultured Bacteroides sp.]|uniref:hypothetical protein n=1 Tax=uncultured Bacteroides sp. TaxID=162156 RepID=UPI0027297046|nr:hypothetical protein [uncultured Bacteroides sp.]